MLSVIDTKYFHCIVSVCSTGRYVMSGNQNGIVSVWDLTSAPISQLNADPILPTVSTFHAHDDTVNGLR